jgi:hypothetical protein
MDISRKVVLLQAPTYELHSWHAFEVRANPEEAPTLHLAGWSGGQTRVCSPIAGVDVLLRSCITRRSKLYSLLAPPAGEALDGSLLELWQKWKSINHISWERDVTDELESVFQSAQDEWGIGAEVVPVDFPTGYFAGTVSGSQPKLLARKIGDEWVVGPTAEELQERHGLCLRLAVQYQRLDEENRPTADDFVHESLQYWDLTPAERRWMVAKINLRK